MSSLSTKLLLWSVVCRKCATCRAEARKAVPIKNMFIEMHLTFSNGKVVRNQAMLLHNMKTCWV